MRYVVENLSRVNATGLSPCRTDCLLLLGCICENKGIFSIVLSLLIVARTFSVLHSLPLLFLLFFFELTSFSFLGN